MLEHCGPPSEVDRAYGALAAHVACHAFAVDGPLREYHLVGLPPPDRALWRTEIGWPVFLTGAAGPEAA
ncbi:GyrI-like domain-containing protein [Streptomyces platensis]|uniref:GyrI-like domain-containing protein n=1 Tax=Streptomyces platensis TaxID=58346 RepID=UPI001F400649|nr:GyrI-like domain-containing protein [Streptomyces platensis]MCF3143274.1 GyrI-like domain-containing protein [Streptomyces platensis]